MLNKKNLTLDRLEGRITQLPILPAVLIELLRLDHKSSGYFDRVIGLVRGDPAFATKLLRYANSAAVGSAHPVETIEASLMLVGARGAVNLIVSHSAARIFLPKSDWELNMWRHAIEVGCLMEEMASAITEVEINPAKAYLCGLLHDIGRFLIYLEAPDELREVDESMWITPDQLIMAEQNICGFTHAELGYLAIRKWKLATELALAVRYHHSIDKASSELPKGDMPLIRLTHDADWISIVLSAHDDLWQLMSDSEINGKISTYRPIGMSGVSDEAFATLVRNALSRSSNMQSSLGLGRSN